MRGRDEATKARPGLGYLLLAVAMFSLGLSQAEAAYRLTFQNGTSIEVQSYEDLGDPIRYQRYGGTVVVPKAQVSPTQEVPSPAPSPPSLALRPPTASSPNENQSNPEPSHPAANPPPPILCTPE